MTLDALIMLAGFLVAVLPFLGFPIHWDTVILVVLGVFIITLGIFVRRRGVSRTGAPKGSGGTLIERTPAADVHEGR